MSCLANRRGRVTRLLLRLDESRFDAVDAADIYYVEAVGGDSVVRTKRKRRYRSTETLAQISARLHGSRFYRVHRSFVVNLDRVRQVRRRPSGDWELKLDPPVNAVIPIARSREGPVFERLGWGRRDR